MNIGELIVRLTVDSSGFKDKLEEANSNLKNTSDKLSSIGQSLTLGITTPILGAGVASFKMAADFNDALGATDQIFKKSSDSMKEWASNLETYYGVAQGEAMTYANMMGTMLVNIGGLTEKEASKQSQALVELAGDLTAMFGGTTESAVQALTGALKGNTSMLDNYGISASVAQIKTKALEMGLIKGKEEMSAVVKQQATLALITEQTANAQGQASREAEGASGQMRTFGTEVKNLSKDLGQVLIPVITPLIAKINELVQKFATLSPETQKTIVAVAGITAAIGPLLMVLGGIGSGISTIMSVIPTLGSMLLGITAPIGLIIAGVLALIAVGVLLYKNWDSVKETAITVWGSVKDTFSTTFELIKVLVTSFITLVSTIWENFGDEITQIIVIAFNTIANIIQSVITVITGVIQFFTAFVTGDWDKMSKSLKTIWTALWESIKTILSGAWGALNVVFGNLFNQIKNWFINLGKQAVSWGKNMIQGFIDGIKAMIGKVKSTVSRVTKAVSDYMGFNSPSKKGEGRFITDWGENMVGGFMDGIQKSLPALNNTLASVIPAMANNPVQNNYGGVTVQNMTVRKDDDIDLIARKLHQLTQTRGRGGGVR